jgi:hypothetical protein
MTGRYGATRPWDREPTAIDRLGGRGVCLMSTTPATDAGGNNKRLVMRRRIAKALAVVAVPCATASRAITPATAHDLNTDRFQVALRPGAEHYEDVGRPGPSIGDYFESRERVFHRCHRVGRNNAHCDETRAGAGRFAFQCTVTLSLRGRGQIAMQGLFAYDRRRPEGNPHPRDNRRHGLVRPRLRHRNTDRAERSNATAYRHALTRK